jgi:uncharacterized membrane protein HdeD (DUF308 family)
VGETESTRSYAGGMATPQTPGSLEQAGAYYAVSLVRSITLLITGLVITFTQNHSPQFGLIVFGIFALVTSISLGIMSRGSDVTKQARGLHMWQAVVSLVVGALALGLSQAGTLFLLWAIVLWSVLVGVAEVFAGWRLPPGVGSRRDWIVQGAMTVVLALIVLTQQADSVAVVGFLGAWTIILGVYLAIAGMSARWSSEGSGQKGSL